MSVVETELKRVSMVWPAELKEQVRELVGNRGLTDFTLTAVREKLRRQAAGQEPRTVEEPPQSASPATGPDLDPAEVAKLPLTQRMAQARSLIQGRESTEPPGRRDRCPVCKDELVNGECWTCPPSYAPVTVRG